MDIVQLIMLATAGAVIYMIYKQVDSGSFQQIHKDKMQNEQNPPQDAPAQTEQKVQMDDAFKQQRIEQLLNKTDELVNENNFQEAKKSIEAALILQENSDNLMRQGFILKNLNEHEEAAQSFQKVLELEPQNDMAYIFLAQVYHAQKEYDKSQTAFEKAIEIDPDSEQTHIEYAKMLLEIQNIQKAKQHIEIVLEKDPQNKEAKNILSNINEGNDEKN